MSKLGLLSILFVALFTPILLSRDPNPRRGLARTLALVAAFNILYAAALLFAQRT